MVRRLPGGSVELTDVSQSTGNRLPLPDHLVFYISTRHGRYSPFAILLAQLSTTSFSCLPSFEARAPRQIWERRRNGVILQINLPEVFGRSPRSMRADYKFKCKPDAVSRGQKWKALVRPRMQRKASACKHQRISRIIVILHYYHFVQKVWWNYIYSIMYYIYKFSLKFVNLIKLKDSCLDISSELICYKINVTIII